MCKKIAIFATGTSDSTIVLKRLLTYIVIALSYLSMGASNYVPQLEVYGRVMENRVDRTLVPFRYQGQYEDSETGLAYNRFRYYSPEMGMYISSDPIGLAGNNPTLYGYVADVNTWLDVWGLDLHHIIPQQIYRNFKDNFKAIPEYDQNVKKKAKDVSNLIDIEPTIHGNHPQYNNMLEDKFLI